jgi:hypothetical protein
MNQLFTAPTDLAPATLAKSADINAITAAVGTAFNKLPTELELKTGTINYAVDTGTANAYLVALPYAPASYTDGLSVVFKALNTNTGAATINVNGLGDKSIRLTHGHAVYAGDITAGAPVVLRYSSTTGYFHVSANSAAAADRAEQSAIESAQSAIDATTNGAIQVGLAADQVALATTQADNAAATYDEFDDRYLGPKATPPTVDNDGAALLIGAMYWDTVTSSMRVWGGSSWVASYLPAEGYLQDSDIGVTVEAYDATILKDADIGGTVLAPNGDGSQLTNMPPGWSYATTLKFS